MTVRSDTAASSVGPFAGPHPGYGPSAWYGSGELLERERRELLAKSWALVADADEVAAPGSFVSATIGTERLVVVRGADGVLRAFHNLCRHRGAPLVDGSGCAERMFTCPYHEWSFDLDGSLRGVPQMLEQFPGIDKRAWGLHAGSVEEFCGMVFAHPDAETTPFSETLGDLAWRLRHYCGTGLVEIARVSMEIGCNWKLVVENHVDVYHLWYLHRNSLGMLDHRRFKWESIGDHWWSYEPRRDGAAVEGFSWLTPDERDGVGAHLVFPNLMVVTTGTHVATYDVVPITPNRSRLTLRIRARCGADPDEHLAEMNAFLQEDVRICELIQSSVGSSRFELGPFATAHEEPVRRFHAAVARAWQ